MATIVDARGKLCPQPVIETKKAIQEQGTPVITMVDDDIARQNVEKMAQQMGLYAESSEIEGGFRILIQPISSDVLSAVMGDAGAAMEQILPTLEPAAFPVQQSRNEPTIVVLSSSCMGTGDDALGAALMKGFVYALTQLNEAPDVILLYNGGAKLSTEGADTVADMYCSARRRRPCNWYNCAPYELWISRLCDGVRTAVSNSPSGSIIRDGV